MAIQIQLRRGTAAQWASANSVLAAGEIGYVIDTGFYKIGDGTTTWSSLNYTVSNTALNANNSAYLGGLIANGYQTTTGLSANVATLTSNNTSFVGSVSAANVVSNAQLSSNLANYQTTAGLSANVLTLTANNTSFVGSVSAANVVSNAQLVANLANYQTTAGLSANVATLTANNTSFVGNITAANVVSNGQLVANLANYQTTSGLSANVLTLTSNNTSFVGSVSAANVVSNAQLLSNLANYQTTAGMSSYQTTAGLSANVATLTSNNTSFVGSVSAANVVSNTQLSSNLANYQTTAGLSANVLTLIANNTSFVGTVSAANVVSNAQLSSNLANYQTTAGLSANVATLTSNNTSFVGTVSAANVVSNAQLVANLSNYQTTAGLSANVATLTANNANNLGGQLPAYYTNATNISTGTIAEARLPYRLNQNLTTTNNVTFANIALTGGTISTAPVNASDIVNKQYADAIATGVNFHPAVRLSTTVTFDATTATYNNGTNGVNATITDNSPYLAISLDGVTAAYGDRVLMRTVSNTAWNGIYVVSNTGSASYPWILTRAYDYDQIGSGVNEIDKGDLIYVLAGTTLAGTAWVQQNDVTTIGTDGISFVQFSSKALYPLTEGAGLYYSVGGAYDGSAASTIAVNTTYIATLTANNAAYLGGTVASGYQTTAGLSANVATLTSNNTSFVGSVSAANVVSNVQLSSNLSNYQTTAGLSANVLTLTANVANYIIANSGIVSNSSGVFVNSAYIASITTTNSNTANNSLYLGGTAAASYQLNSTLSANVATLTANNTSFVGTVSAANVVSNAQLSSNLANYQLISGMSSYQTTTGLSANVATLTANNSNNLGGQLPAYYTNATNITTGTLPYTQIPANIINTTAAFTISGVHTYNANLVIAASAGISANGSYGTTNQVLTSNGSTVYWANTGAGGFTNGQSISVANLVITGSVTANSSNGTAGQVLTSNSTGVYWAAPAATVTAANATSQSFTGNGSNTVFTLTNSVANQKNVIVSMNGLLQVPVTHYTISGTTLTFTDAPYTGAVIEARSIEGVALVSNGSGSGSAGYTRTSNTATSGQTSFAATYTVGNVLVYVNGVLLNTSDYTATSGTSIVLNDAASLNDIVEIITISGGSSISSGDLFLGAMLLGGM